jgi:hypothetical protein
MVASAFHLHATLFTLALSFCCRRYPIVCYEILFSRFFLFPSHCMLACLRYRNCNSSIILCFSFMEPRTVILLFFFLDTLVVFVLVVFFYFMLFILFTVISPHHHPFSFDLFTTLMSTPPSPCRSCLFFFFLPFRHGLPTPHCL